MSKWLGLMIGNSRLHWAYCCQSAAETPIQQTWNSPHLSIEAMHSNPKHLGDASVPCPNRPNQLHRPNSLPSELRQLLDDPTLSLWVASVVPAQTPYWLTHPNVNVITLKDIPLGNLYPTLGIDRALAALGAWHSQQTAALVIDGGTALTLTGVNANGQLMGGAIMPGLRLQLRSLHQHTAALPDTALSPDASLTRWQTNTPEAIKSGVWYGLQAGVQDFIRDWLAQQPHCAIVFTGGDGEKLWDAIKGPIASSYPLSSTPTLLYDPHLIFKGMATLYNAQSFNV